MIRHIKDIIIMERERSSKEEDTLERSTKKIKKIHLVNEINIERLRDVRYARYSANSYKDKLVGSISGAYEQAFGFSASMDEEAESDEDDDELYEGMAKLKVSSEEKAGIRAPWSQSIIVKAFGKSVGFVYMSSKLRTMWNPSGRMDCVDMGPDFFFDQIVGPEFKASKAKCSSIAVWVRLPELSIEYYDPIMLKNGGSTIGPVLRIDSHTFNGARGRFARIYVQINIDKSLINSIKIGKMVQPVQYEGIHMLCFACGCIGHRKDSCPSIVRGPKPTIDNEGNNATEANSSPKEASTTETIQDNGKANKEEVEGAGFKGDGDDRSNSYYPLRDSKPDHRRDVKRKAVEKETLEKRVVEPVLSQPNQMYARNHMSEVAIENSRACKPNSRKVEPNHGKKYSMGWESRKWPVKATSDSTLVKKNSFNCLGGFTFEAKAQENEYTSREMGNFFEGQGDTYWRQNDRRDSEGPNRHNGLTNVSSSNQHGLDATTKSLLEAALRRSNECFGDDSSKANNLSEKNPPREIDGDGSHGQPIPCEAFAL
nr:hypothetical protein CFP56_38467 [Quercus suber]